MNVYIEDFDFDAYNARSVAAITFLAQTTVGMMCEGNADFDVRNDFVLFADRRESPIATISVQKTKRGLAIRILAFNEGEMFRPGRGAQLNIEQLPREAAA